MGISIKEAEAFQARTLLLADSLYKESVAVKEESDKMSLTPGIHPEDLMFLYSRESKIRNAAYTVARLHISLGESIRALNALRICG